MYNFIRLKVQDDQAAWDIYQDTYVRIATNKHRYNPSFAFSTWAFNIAKNLCFTFIRKQKGRARFSAPRPMDKDGKTEKPDPYPSEDPLPDEQLEETELRRCFEAALARLPLRSQMAVLLYLEGYPHEGIAAKLDISYANSRAIVSRSFKKIQKHCRRFAGGE